MCERFGYQDVRRRRMMADDRILMIRPLWAEHSTSQGGAKLEDVAMIDRSALDQLRQTLGDDPADLIDLLEIFLEEAPDMLASMVAAAEAGDLVVVMRHAHSLKSNSRDVGATALGGLCASLEGDMRDGRDPGDIHARLNALGEEFGRVKHALTQEIARMGTAY